MNDWLTITEWAESLGVSRQAAHAAIRRLKIELVDGKVHAAKATAIYKAMTRTRVRVAGRKAGNQVPVGEHVSYDEARRREAVATARIREREAALQAGTLVEVDKLRDVMGKHLVAAREIAMSCGARLAPVVAAESDIATVHRLIDLEMHRMLHEIAGTDYDLAARQQLQAGR